MLKIKSALISVFDKTGLATIILKNNYIILSTGGTAKILKEANVGVTDITDYTRFPEIMDGRVKTINPLISGGILGLRDKHQDEAKNNEIKWIDLVICNLYPFSDAISRPNCDAALALENIDIGGPTMIRSAAKNLGWVCVAIDPNDYQLIANDILANKSLIIA